MKYNPISLFLVDKAEHATNFWGDSQMSGVSEILMDYFTQISQKAADCNGVFVTWAEDRAYAGPTDLVVYFLTDPSRSIIQNRFQQDVAHGGGGTYQSSAGMISEVHLSEQEGDAHFARLVANIAFHELMHNKLDSDATPVIPDIHNLGGGGLSSPVINSNMRPTVTEIVLMARYIGRKIPQYTAAM